MTAAAATRFAHFVADLSLEDLPAEVVSDVSVRVLDVLGLCVRAGDLDTSRAAIEFAVSQSPRGASTAVGVPTPLSASWAAFVNGVLAHSLDYDDTHLASVLHPSASVVPAALAVAEEFGARGDDVVVAIAAGLELCVRLGMGGFDEEKRNSAFFEHGQHATSICGALGAAAAAARIAGLDARGIEAAIGIAASMSSGILESNRNGGTVKRLHCGWAAHAGVSAALLARAGITAAPTVLEGRFGFFRAWLHEDVDAAALTDRLGEVWLERDIVPKPYPANHFTHPVVDTALRLRAQGVCAADIDSVQIHVAAPVIRTIGEPIEVKRAPKNGYMAQFSAPYVFAAALLGGGGLGIALGDFDDDLVRSPERTALMQRISVVVDADATDSFPRRFAARVTAHLTDGRVVEDGVEDTRGSSAYPLTYAEVTRKYRDNVEGMLDPHDAEALAERVRELSGANEVTSCLVPLRRAGLDVQAGVAP